MEKGVTKIESDLGDVQQMWFRRTQAPEVIERPSCYNRPAFVRNVYSEEFPGKWYKFRQTQECPHWKPGGNAHVRKMCDSASGKTTPWHACSGCLWKPW
jgi:hypothetical protein